MIRTAIALTAAAMIFVLMGAAECEADNERVFKYETGDRRDPFMPPIVSQKRLSVGLDAVESIEDVKFEGVIYDPIGGSIAVLNSEVVREGDKVNNVEIVRICDDTVILRIYDKTHTIVLDQEGGN